MTGTASSATPASLGMSVKCAMGGTREPSVAGGQQAVTAPEAVRGRGVRLGLRALACRETLTCWL